MKGVGALALSAVALSACAPVETPQSAASAPAASATGAAAVAVEPTSVPTAEAQTDELGDPLTPFESVTNYNNFYEFSMDKEAVAPLSKDFVTEPWTLTVGGLVGKPRTFSVDDLVKSFPPEERVYRLRCVEAWSMVIPWLGFSLAGLAERGGTPVRRQIRSL